jgi:hypothetical protein
MMRGYLAAARQLNGWGTDKRIAHVWGDVCLGERMMRG